MSIKMLRLKQVMEVTGLSRTTIYDLTKTGKFPKPIHLGAKAVAWVDSELQDWLQARIAASRGQPACLAEV